jgi:outer membrane protein OmpA-like peptidoglycan-associated protein
VKYPDVTVVVEGHTDERASDAYNVALSERRAEAVRSYLLSRGVAGSRLRMEALGKTRLESAGNGKEEHARNRRVLLRYSGGDGAEVGGVAQFADLQLEPE